MTRIRRMNIIIGAIGTVALIVGASVFSSSFTDFLLLLAALSLVEGIAVHLYRKHRLRKHTPAFQDSEMQSK